ncbi:STAS domain-containing protein [Patescibacteria group bacterium AH-259-L05]|nr:STAS domain-containing protein [Patescibacteria group bacterium AH-259-L05]
MTSSIHFTKKQLIFRSDAQKLFQRINRKIKQDGARHIVIDFSGVDFFSRSFIDEFLNGLNKFKKKGVKVQLKNIKPFLQMFINRVSTTKARIQKEFFMCRRRMS